MPLKVWMETPTCTPKGQGSVGLGALVVAWAWGAPGTAGVPLWPPDVFRAWARHPPGALEGSGSSLQKGPRMLWRGPSSKWGVWDSVVFVPSRVG